MNVATGEYAAEEFELRLLQVDGANKSGARVYIDLSRESKH